MGNLLSRTSLLQDQPLSIQKLPGPAGRQGGDSTGIEQGHANLQIDRRAGFRLHQAQLARGCLLVWHRGPAGLHPPQFGRFAGGVSGWGWGVDQGVEQLPVGGSIGLGRQTLGSKTNCNSHQGHRRHQHQPAASREAQEPAPEPSLCPCKVPFHRRWPVPLRRIMPEDANSQTIPPGRCEHCQPTTELRP